MADPDKYQAGVIAQANTVRERADIIDNADRRGVVAGNVLGEAVQSVLLFSLVYGLSL